MDLPLGERVVLGDDRLAAHEARVGGAARELPTLPALDVEAAVDEQDKRKPANPDDKDETAEDDLTRLMSKLPRNDALLVPPTQLTCFRVGAHLCRASV